MKKLLTAFFALGLSLTSTPSFAIQGGAEVIGSPDVVALLFSDSATRPKCSAALVDSMIVLTAAHCVTRPNSEGGELEMDAEAYWISAPGEDLNLGEYRGRTQVAKVFRTQGYVNMWKPNEGDIRTQKDDIAFLVLQSPVPGRTTIPLVNAAELERIKRDGLLITHVGYGLQNQNSINGKPYSVDLVANSRGSSRYGNNPALEVNTITSNETGAKAVCPGDSGSPWYATIDGVKKIVASTVGGSGCGGSGVNGALGTSVSGYSEIYEKAKAESVRILTAIQSRNLKKSVRKFKTCRDLNEVFAGGLAKSKSTSLASKTKFEPFISPVGYKNNSKLDRDKDGIVCEK